MPVWLQTPMEIGKNVPFSIRNQNKLPTFHTYNEYLWKYKNKKTSHRNSIIYGIHLCCTVQQPTTDTLRSCYDRDQFMENLRVCNKTPVQPEGFRENLLFYKNYILIFTNYLHICMQCVTKYYIQLYEYSVVFT